MDSKLSLQGETGINLGLLRSLDWNELDENELNLKLCYFIDGLPIF